MEVPYDIPVENPMHEFDEVERCPVGRDPRVLSLTELESAGHTKRPLLDAIRENCVDCSGGNKAEVRRCPAVTCPLWPYRMGSNPFRAEPSEARKVANAAAGERLAAARKAHKG